MAAADCRIIGRKVPEVRASHLLMRSMHHRLVFIHEHLHRQRALRQWRIAVEIMGGALAFGRQDMRLSCSERRRPAGRCPRARCRHQAPWRPGRTTGYESTGPPSFVAKHRLGPCRRRRRDNVPIVADGAVGFGFHGLLAMREERTRRFEVYARGAGSWPKELLFTYGGGITPCFPGRIYNDRNRKCLASSIKGLVAEVSRSRLRKR